MCPDPLQSNPKPKNNKTNQTCSAKNIINPIRILAFCQVKSGYPSTWTTVIDLHFKYYCFKYSYFDSQLAMQHYSF